jgi:hypothetical protein
VQHWSTRVAEILVSEYLSVVAIQKSRLCHFDVGTKYQKLGQNANHNSFCHDITQKKFQLAHNFLLPNNSFAFLKVFAPSRQNSQLFELFELCVI